MAAAIASSAIGEVASLIGGTSIGSTLARGALTGIGAVAAGDLINAIAHDLSAGGQSAATARRVPQYAIVDLHNNKTIRFLSARKVYIQLTAHSRRRRSRSTKVLVVPRGEEFVRVK